MGAGEVRMKYRIIVIIKGILEAEEQIDVVRLMINELPAFTTDVLIQSIEEIEEERQVVKNGYS